ncbi:MAG: hypothetical protein AAF499_00740 [Pseudomonadota bacterium]
MLAIICIVRPERVDELVELACKALERHIGVISVADCRVLRVELLQLNQYVTGV